MPRGDRTGPSGMGPMTGRSAGFCAGGRQPGYMSAPAGRGIGRDRRSGFGRSFGMGRGFGGRGAFPGPQNYGYAQYSTPTGFAPWGAPLSAPSAEDEVEMLKAQAGDLEHSLEDILRRISELEEEKE